MKIKLIPRFSFTLHLWMYFRFLFSNSLNKVTLFKNRGKIYFTNYARASLYLLLKSISSKQLIVGVQAFTCHSVFKAIKKYGHKSIFIDLDNNFKLDIKDLKKKINKIDVLIITHTFGYPENINEIKKISKDIIIIEDCSHSFLSKINNKYTGTFGDASIFSLGLAKFPSIGFGGFALINNIKKFPNFISIYSNLPFPNLFNALSCTI